MKIWLSTHGVRITKEPGNEMNKLLPKFLFLPSIKKRAEKIKR